MGGPWRLGGQMGQVTVVDIGKNVLHLTDKKINAWVDLQQEDNRVDGNQKEVDLTHLDDGDEDEVAFLEEIKVKEEEDQEAEEEALRKAEEEEAALWNAKKRARPGRIAAQPVAIGSPTCAATTESRKVNSDPIL